MCKPSGGGGPVLDRARRRPRDEWLKPLIVVMAAGYDVVRGDGAALTTDPWSTDVRLRLP